MEELLRSYAVGGKSFPLKAWERTVEEINKEEDWLEECYYYR